MTSKIVSHNDFFIAVGKVTNMAAIVDCVLFSAYHVLTKNTDIEVSRSVFFSFDALPSRENLVKRLLEVIGNDKEKEIVNKIILACKKVNNQRKQVAHAVSFNMPGFNKELELEFNLKVYHPKSNKEIKPTESYIKTLVDHSLEAYNHAIINYGELTKELGLRNVLYH